MKIRTATKEDSADILKLIKELASFEKEVDAVNCTVEDINRFSFGDEKLISSLVLEVEQKVVAMAVYFFSWSTWTGKKSLYLEDLYIQKSHRKKGYATKLIQELASIALSKDCQRLDLMVLEWNVNAIELYKKHSFKLKTDWIPCRLERQDMQKLIQKA